MKSEPHFYQQRLYLSPTKGWTSVQQPDTVYRLDAKTKIVETGQANNAIYKMDENNVWQPVDPSSLAAWQRGWVWTAHRVVIATVKMVAFHGMAVVDASNVHLLNALTVHNRQGIRVDSENLLSLGADFCLLPDEANVFSQRVKEADGRIIKGNVVPDDIEKALTDIDYLVYELEEIAELDRGAMQAARDKDFSDASDNDFVLRGQQIRLKLKQATEISIASRFLLNQMIAVGYSPETLVEVQSKIDDIGRALSSCQVIAEKRVNDEQALVQMIVQQGYTRKNKLSEPPTTKLMLHEFGLWAARQGLDMQETPDGVRILTEHGWLRLGPGIEFED